MNRRQTVALAFSLGLLAVVYQCPHARYEARYDPTDPASYPRSGDRSFPGPRVPCGTGPGRGVCGTQWGFLPRWEFERFNGQSTPLFNVMMLNASIACAALIYYFGRWHAAPRAAPAAARGARRVRNAGLIYLLLGLLWALFGAGIYGSPLGGLGSTRLALTAAGLALGPFLVLPARYLIRDPRSRGLALVVGGCASPILLVYGLNEVSDLLVPSLFVLTLPMVLLGASQMRQATTAPDA